MTHQYTGYEIELANGKPFDPSSPDHRVLDLETVAHALANTCRYGGHCERYLSVAEHAVLVSTKLGRLGASRGVQLAGLHHDDAEALDGVGDVLRPAKGLLGDAYRERTRRINHCVWRAFAWPNPAKPMLWEPGHLYDELLERVDQEWAIRLEVSQGMVSQGVGWPQFSGLPEIPIESGEALMWWAPPTAKAAFLARHRELAG